MAIGLCQARIAFSEDAFGGAIVHHAVGFECPALVKNLNIAKCFNGVLIVVVDQLLGLDQHPVFWLAWLGSGGPLAGDRQGLGVPIGCAQDKRKACPGGKTKHAS